MMKQIYVLLITCLLPLCSSGQKPTQTTGPANDPALQISQYIRRIFQDKKGNLWFGTNNDGICRYRAGQEQPLDYFLKGTAVRGMLEDERGIWFATSRGIFLCAANTESDNKPLFTNLTVRDGLPDDGVWSVCKDKNGIIWFGTEEGACRYDGKTFTSFPLPVPEVKEYPTGIQRAKIIWDIEEDKNGDIWFATYGGLYRYDTHLGTPAGNGMLQTDSRPALTNYKAKEGLGTDFVFSIFEDKKGDLWFGTRNGIVKYGWTVFADFKVSEEPARSSCELQNKAGHLWFYTLRKGVSRYDGKTLTHYAEADGLSNLFVQSIFEDRSGKLWFGTGAGLFRFDGTRFVNITKTGPWN